MSREKPIIVTPITVDNNPTAQELRGVLCSSCFEFLLASMTGKVNATFTPCGTCHPKCIAWLQQRRAEGKL